MTRCLEVPKCSLSKMLYQLWWVSYHNVIPSMVSKRVTTFGGFIEELAELPEEQKKTAATKAVGSPSRYCVVFFVFDDRCGPVLFSVCIFMLDDWLSLRPLLHIVRCGETCGHCRSACECIAWRHGAGITEQPIWILCLGNKHLGFEKKDVFWSCT